MPGDLVPRALLSRNLADLVRLAATEHPDAVALVDRSGPSRHELGWAALDAQVAALAAGWAGVGLRAGQRLVLLGATSPAFVVAYLAALRAGLVAVPLNPQSTRDELRAVLADSGARLLLADDPRAGAVADLGVPVLPLTADGLAALRGASALPGSPADPETLAVLLYTAGTSGRPKAVMLSHRALLAHVAHTAAVGNWGPDSVVLAALPLFHVFGLNAVLGGWLGAGARLVLADPAALDWDLLGSEAVTDLPVVPSLLHRLLEQDPPVGPGALRQVVSGAAPLPAEVAAAFEARTGLRVEQGYGLTEAAPGVTLTIGSGATGPGHVGRPLPGVELRIGDGTDPGEPGEVHVRGDNLFSGYWPDGHGGPDADGWFGTGDIGYLVDGELVLVDRSRELVLVNGFPVYPIEVEQVIGEVKAVTGVAVVGRPDARSGERLVAFVEGEQVDPAEVTAHCTHRLARFKQPADVRVVPALPRGATGKVRKGELRAQLAGNQAGGGR